MNVIKSQNVAGRVSAFVPVADTKVASVSEAESPVSHEIDPAEVLNKLGVEQRKTVLESIFAEELEDLKEQALSEGFEKGRTLAETEVKPQLNAKLDELTQQIEAWKEMLLTAESDDKWILERDDEFLSMLFQATLKLLTVELTQQDCAKRILTGLLGEYADSKPKHLVVSKLHYQQLEQLNVLETLNQEFDVIVDNNLIPGSYKVSLQNGSFEYDLDKSLEEFKAGLVNLLDVASQ